MKRLIIPIVFTALLFSSAFFGGCYTDTIDSLSTFTFQLAIPFHSTHYEKAAPDTSYDFTNLNAYKEYRDNRERIKKAMILEFNYWVDSIVMRNADPDLPDIPYDPEIHGDTISFEFVKFYLRFAKLKPGAGDPLSDDSTDWMMDPNEKDHLLGEFYDVNVADYYRQAHNIVEVNEEVARLISEAAKNRPAFYVITEYSKVKGQDLDEEPKRYFPYVAARYDLVIRFDVEL